MAENPVETSQQVCNESSAPARDRLAMFEEAVAQVRSGETSVDGFSVWLEEMAAQMAERQRHLQEIYDALPPELAGAFVEEAEVGFQGITLYLDGIAHLRAYARQPQDELLDRALTAMRAGNALIVNAMHINRQNREAEDETSPLDEPDETTPDDETP